MVPLQRTFSSNQVKPDDNIGSAHLLALQVVGQQQSHFVDMLHIAVTIEALRAVYAGDDQCACKRRSLSLGLHGEVAWPLPVVKM